MGEYEQIYQLLFDELENQKPKDMVEESSWEEANPIDFGTIDENYELTEIEIFAVCSLTTLMSPVGRNSTDITERRITNGN
jgi:hypothetical protein